MRIALCITGLAAAITAAAASYDWRPADVIACERMMVELSRSPDLFTPVEAGKRGEVVTVRFDTVNGLGVPRRLTGNCRIRDGQYLAMTYGGETIPQETLVILSMGFDDHAQRRFHFPPRL